MKPKSHHHHHEHHHHEREKLTDLTARLRRSARKITGPRQAILEVLRHHPHPLTNKEIFAELPKGQCDLATIYRSMHMLETMGLVKRFDFGDGVARFELVGEGDQAHHHHLICTKCAEVVEIDECFQHELEESIAARHGYKSVTHKLEFFGICPECQTRKD
ncbi:MAG: Fur family transcriptional regulator [Verrucomicrobiota bacterium]